MRIVIVGTGKMGTLIYHSARACGHEVVECVEKADAQAMRSLECDAIIDFSHPDNIKGVCTYSKEKHCILVCGTTALREEDKEMLKETAKVCPVFYSANYSYGVALMTRLVEIMTPLLQDAFDMELIETHHNQKQDAPSGTAAMLLNAMDPENAYDHVYQRKGFVGKRGKEIGIHSVRGGTAAGEHTVMYLGDDETLKLTHTATSRQIFVNGALRALAFMEEKQPGFYTMNDLIGDIV